MPYVTWKSSKYHVLTQFSPRGLSVSDGRASAVWKDGSGLALTDCGSEVPDDNKVFERLPEGIDVHNEVCHKCSGGVGVPKIDREAERARQLAEAEAAKKKADKRRYDLASAAAELFD